MAMLVQTLSAKLGIVTGKNLAEHIRDRLPAGGLGLLGTGGDHRHGHRSGRVHRRGVGFKLLLGVTLLEGAAITAVVTWGILMLQSRGQKPLEFVVGGLLLPWRRPTSSSWCSPAPTCRACWRVPSSPACPTATPSIWHRRARCHRDAPRHLPALGIDPAHPGSGLGPQRLHTTRVDVAIAMTIAGFVNLAMMAMAAAAFHSSGNQQVAELESAYQTLTPLLGQAAATLFGLSLVASGISSTVVGTLAGQVVMQGFVRFTIPLWLRRAITMAPAFVVIAMGLNTTEILVLSQVVLSFGIALALIPLLILTGDRALMGQYRNHPVTQAVYRLIVALVIGLNAYLLVAMIQPAIPSQGRLVNRG